jgi:UDP-N-acetylmuramate dehydrogenase
MEIKKNIQLKEYSTFQIGGPAKFFCEAGTLDELKEALNWAKEKKQRTYVMGGGSNALFMDKGFDGLVIKILNRQLEMKDEKTILAGAGVVFMELVNFSVKNGLTGLEWATGIPGFVGGALRGNAGAFGGEMKDCVKKIRALHIDNGVAAKELELSEFDNAQCEFEYRNSFFKKLENLVIWDCEIELEKGDMQKSKESMHDILQKRKQNQPQLGQFPSLGSVFKNPVASEKVRKQFEEDKNVQCQADKVPAGWLIEQCDLKEKMIGGAMVSPIQANFIVNMGNATSEDVLILLSLIKMKVRNEQGVQLEEEIQIVI